MACVTAAGEILSLAFIASGKTTWDEELQIDAVEGQWRTHSESGWQTSEAFQKYLMKIHTEIGEGPIYFLLDSYSAH
jgi:hypothetical protein